MFFQLAPRVSRIFLYWYVEMPLGIGSGLSGDNMTFQPVSGDVVGDFGTWYSSSSLPGTWPSSKGPLKMGPFGCPKTSLTNY